MYLVCDGGGTKTEYLLFDTLGHVRGYAKGAGTNAIFTDPERAAAAVREGIQSCLAQAGLSEPEGIYLFIPGFRSALGRLRSAYPGLDIRLFGDEYNAFYGAVGGPQGIAVLSGTGSFAVGRDLQGHWYTAGGWGPLFGDQGSGYHMGCLCLEKAAQLYDRGISGTLLQQYTMERIGIHAIPELRETVYRPDFTREKVAALSRVVAEAGAKGDPEALEILDMAADALAELAAIAAERMGIFRQRVSLTGGTPRMGPILTERFRKAVEARLPDCSCQPPATDPIAGAALYVMYEILCLPALSGEFLERLEKEMREYYVDG